MTGFSRRIKSISGDDRKEISDSVVDTALNELVLTGQLEDSLKGVSDAEVEEFIAYIKALIAKDDLTDDAGINGAIDEACENMV